MKRIRPLTLTCALSGALLAPLALTGCAEIGGWFEEMGDDVEEASEEVEDEIDDATD